MAEWNLSEMLSSLHDGIQNELHTARKTLAHPGTKGDASERVWLQLLQTYLPKRYQVESAHVVDSEGNFSDQMDVVVFDRQYSPFIFNFKAAKIVPAESVYAVFEAKQTMDASLLKYAKSKIASVRQLKCTSLPIPYADGEYPAKPPIHILGGMLTLESEWNPPLGEALIRNLGDTTANDRLDLGCVASHGFFGLNRKTQDYDIHLGKKPATGFLFHLISELQCAGTVPMIDINAYAKWLTD